MNKWAEKVRTLYLKEKLSGVEIARELNLNRRYVYRIMDRSDIKRRKAHESNNIRFLRQAPSFSKKKKLGHRDMILLTSGIMLYWAEGAKYKNKNTLDFANSSPLMIKVFMKFIRDICGVKEEKIRIYLYCYANQNVQQLKQFWSKLTKVPVERFIKPYVRKDFREDKINKMPHGLIHVRYFDKKLYIQFEDWQQLILKKIFGGVVE